MSDIEQLIESIRTEMRAGFVHLGGRIDSLEARFDTSEVRSESRFDTFESRFDTLERMVYRTNETLDQFRLEVNTKLAGISKLFLASENNIRKLEKRVKKLEDGTS